MKGKSQRKGSDSPLKFDGLTLLTAEEVAKRYGRPVQWVYRCKMLPKRKAGKFVYFRVDDLERFEIYRNTDPSVRGRGFHIPTTQKLMRQNLSAVDMVFAKKALKFDVK